MQAAAREQGRRLGIGLACYVEGTGVGPYEGAHVVVETSGKVKVATGLTSQGQGHQTVFAQIVADELGVPIGDIEVTTGDTRAFGYAVGTFASRAAVMSGSAIALAARAARAKAIRVAAAALEASPDDMEIVDGMVRVKGDPESGIALGTVAVLSNPLRYAFDEAAKAATQFAGGDIDKPPVAEGDAPGIEGREFFSPVRSTFASGMHAVIVETDPQTAEIKILRYCVVHDCGTLINPRIVEGQIHGGVAQGVGGALYERMAYDETGQLQNASFMDFLMPYVSEVPDGHRDRPPGDAVAAQPARHQGRWRGGRDPERGRVRRRDRGRRGHPDHLDADLAQRPVRAARCAGVRRGGRRRGGLVIAVIARDELLDPGAVSGAEHRRHVVQLTGQRQRRGRDVHARMPAAAAPRAGVGEQQHAQDRHRVAAAAEELLEQVGWLVQLRRSVTVRRGR